MAFRTTILERVPEGVSAQITGQFNDETGTAIALATLTAVTLTLYDQSSGTIVNLRDHADILNANGGVITATGGLTLTLSYADGALISQTPDYETHVALIEWSWNAGAKRGKAEVVFSVVNLTKVT